MISISWDQSHELISAALRSQFVILKGRPLHRDGASHASSNPYRSARHPYLRPSADRQLPQLRAVLFRCFG